MTAKPTAIKQLLIVLVSITLMFSAAIVGALTYPFLGKQSVLGLELSLFALGSLTLLASTGRLRALGRLKAIRVKR